MSAVGPDVGRGRIGAWLPFALLLLLAPASATAVVVAVGSEATSVDVGLPDAGSLPVFGLPVFGALRDMGAVLTVGSLVAISTLLGDEPRARLSAPQTRAMRVAALGAALWMGAGAAQLLLAYAELIGQDPLRLSLQDIRFYGTQIESGLSLSVSLLLATMVWLGSFLVRTTPGTGVLTVLAILGLWPLALRGHSGSPLAHDVAVTAQFAHLLALGVWVGGLLTLFLVRRHLDASYGVIERYSRAAAWCFVVVAVSGVASASARLPTWSSLASTYGGVLILKVVLYALIGLIAIRIRSRLSAPPAAVVPVGWASKQLGRLLGAELFLLVTATGAGVGLGRLDPPEQGVSISSNELLLGYPMPDGLDLGAWFTSWRLDPLWGTFAIAIAVLYLLGVRRLRQRGDRWPVGRSAAWLAGSAGLLWSTSGAPGVYGDVLFSMHMVQHMTIAFAVPTVLVLGAPVTLALRALHRRADRSWGAREWLLYSVHSWPLRLLAHPVVSTALFVVGLIAFYYSSLFELALSTHTGHVLMVGHFLSSGYLFANMVCGIDPGPARPIFPVRILLVMVTFGIHAFFSISLMSSTRVLAVDWFSALQRTWGAGLAEDQYLGASLGWALGDYPLAILAGAVIWRWVNDDAREARRLDRAADRDGDAALATYNAHLTRLQTASNDLRRER